MKIKLFCAIGMSTSILVNNMKEVAKKRNFDVDIKASSSTQFEDEVKDADIALLGPQIAYMLDDLTSVANGVPIEVIPMQDYGMMNGENVLNFALKLFKEKKEEEKK